MKKIYCVYDMDNQKNRSGLFYYSSKKKAFEDYDFRYKEKMNSEYWRITSVEEYEGSLLTKKFAYECIGHEDINYITCVEAHDVNWGEIPLGTYQPRLRKKFFKGVYFLMHLHII